MTKRLIKDIPSIKKNLDSGKTLVILKKSMPIIEPFLNVIGVDTTKIEKAFADVDHYNKLAEELAQIPDRFNDLFAERGWIIYDMMTFEVAKSAIKIMESDDSDAAEKFLADYYSVENVRWKLLTMNGVRAFHSRMQLAEKALLDYEEERYHACVPVVLALLDGLVNELHEEHKGFFAEDINLTAWDSIAAHSKGLNVLSEIFNKGRKTTRTEQITIPYRNGIMHGMDLGYDNKIVAAKSWAALFATREWALKVEKGQLTAPPKEPEKTFGQIAKQIKENAVIRERLDKWKPRILRIGIDTPKSGEAVEYGDRTPEKVLAEYLHLWMKRNYGFMARYVVDNIAALDKKTPAIIRKAFESKELKSYEFMEICDNAPAVTAIQTSLTFIENHKELTISHKFRLVNYDAKRQPSVRDTTDTQWAIINWGIYSY